MSPEHPPRARKSSLVDSIARVFFATIVLAIIVNVVVLGVMAWITGQGRH